MNINLELELMSTFIFANIIGHWYYEAFKFCTFNYFESIIYLFFVQLLSVSLLNYRKED